MSSVTLTEDRKTRSQLDLYLAGQRTLDARNRTEIKQKRFLAFTCLGLLTICGVQTVENYRNSSHSRLVPYIIQTDSAGRILNTEILKDRAIDENFSSQKTIHAEISNWIEDWRTVTTDVYAQKTLATHVFNLVDGQSDASGWLVNWFKTHDPVERAKAAHVEVTVKNILPQSLTTYEVYWEERSINISDSTQTVSRWRSVITTTINPPRTEGDVLKNRFGLYIQHITDPQMETTHE